MSKLIPEWKSFYKMWSVWLIALATVIEGVDQFYGNYFPWYVSFVLMIAAMVARLVSQQKVIEWVSEHYLSLSRYWWAVLLAVGLLVIMLVMLQGTSL